MLPTPTPEERLEAALADPAAKEWAAERALEAREALDAEAEVLKQVPRSRWGPHARSLFIYDDWCAYSLNGSEINPRIESIRGLIRLEFQGNPASALAYWRGIHCDPSEAEALATAYVDALESHDFGRCGLLEDGITNEAAGWVEYSMFRGEDCAVPCAGRLEFTVQAPPEPGDDPEFDRMVRQWNSENPAPATPLERLRGRQERRPLS